MCSLAKTDRIEAPFEDILGILETALLVEAILDHPEVPINLSSTTVCVSSLNLLLSNATFCVRRYE